jgi:hypothetical protein
MMRIYRPLLLLSLMLAACSSMELSPATPPATLATDMSASNIPATSITQVLPSTEAVATVSTPGIEQELENATTVAPSDQLACAYQWAQEPLPELSTEFQRSIQLLQPEAQANAYAFGENCIRADGTSTFGAMETDFNVTLQVPDLSNAADLGDWIVKVMQVVENIPPDQIEGTKPGKVSMIYQSNGEQKIVNFYIDQYQALPAGLSNAEIYQALSTPQ